MRQTKNHLQLSVDKLPETVLLPGDPGRIAEIAACLDHVRQVGDHRGFLTIVGEYKGTEIAACSSGIGGPSVEIAVVELKRYGVRRVIRVGTSGGIGQDVLPGHLVVLSGCVRYSGAADLFVPVNYPAVSDFRTALFAGRERQKNRSSGSFRHRPFARLFLRDENPPHPREISFDDRRKSGFLEKGGCPSVGDGSGYAVPPVFVAPDTSWSDLHGGFEPMPESLP